MMSKLPYKRVGEHRPLPGLVLEHHRGKGQVNLDVLLLDLATGPAASRDGRADVLRPEALGLPIVHGELPRARVQNHPHPQSLVVEQELPGAQVGNIDRRKVANRAAVGGRGRDGDLKTKNGRKNVKSVRYRPILSANRRRQRPAHVHARTNPAQNGQNGGN